MNICVHVMCLIRQIHVCLEENFCVKVIKALIIIFTCVFRVWSVEISTHEWINICTHSHSFILNTALFRWYDSIIHNNSSHCNTLHFRLTRAASFPENSAACWTFRGEHVTLQACEFLDTNNTDPSCTQDTALLWSMTKNTTTKEIHVPCYIIIIIRF